jgi:hypothetical protein
VFANASRQLGSSPRQLCDVYCGFSLGGKWRKREHAEVKNVRIDKVAPWEDASLETRMSLARCDPCLQLVINKLSHAPYVCAL